MSANEMVTHVLHTLSDFSKPPSAGELVDRIVQISRYDRRDAQKAIRICLDRGYCQLGNELRIEKAS